jgi:ubiquitin-conjugating enzyme E2 M
LDELCDHLGLRSEDRQAAVEGPVDSDTRPLTGGTSASASTTVPGGSSGFEVASLGASTGFEAASLDHEETIVADSDNPFDSLQGGQRVSYEMQQGNVLPHGCRLERAPGTSAQFFLSVDASEGPYAPATLKFWIKVFNEFPASDGVSIRSTQRIFHPNIDPDSGQVRLQPDSLERVCRFKDVLSAIRRLVVTPTDSPAANADAAMLLQTDPEEFRRTVRTTLGGGEYRSVRFDRVLDFNKKSSKEVVDESQLPQMSEQMRLELMKLEVLQGQFKAFADTMIKQNTAECRDLEHEQALLHQ